MINVEASSSSCGQHFWHNYPIRIGNNRILCNLFAVSSKWQSPSNNRTLTIHTSCSSHSWIFSSYFHIFSPFCGRCSQQGLKTVPCATTLVLGYAWNNLWIVAILRTVPDVHCCTAFLEALNSTCVVNANSKFCWRERNVVIFTVSPRRFNCWSLQINTSAFLFHNLSYLLRSEPHFCVILWGSAEVGFRKKIRISWSRWLW